LFFLAYKLVCNQGDLSGILLSIVYHPYQWRRHTRAHTDPGSGEFLCALVNHARSTYTAIALLYIELRHVEKLSMPLIYDF